MTGSPSSLPLDELLATGDFVHRLARSLVFDREQVDDVVQEAWLAALRHPPRERAAAVGWFRAVLGNLARRRARDDSRRRRRELAVAPAVAAAVGPSPADVLAREEARREVVEAVLALSEPYRSVVLARYFDDQEPAAIARRRGIPAATVRAQLHRGLEMLRARLQERHGDERQLGLWLLPLAQRAKTTGLWLTLTGGFVMMKVWIGSALAAAALAWLLWPAGPGPHVLPGTVDSSVPSPAVAAAAASAPAVALPERAASVGAQRPPEGSAAVGGNAGLRGRVVLPGGEPVADTLVRAIGLDGSTLFADAPANGAGSLSWPTASARTDAAGQFVIHGLSPRVGYMLHAAEDSLHRTLRAIHAWPRPDEVVDIGDFVLVPKGGIRGRVVDGDGEPVADAEVFAADLPGLLAESAGAERIDPTAPMMLSLPIPGDDGNTKGYRRRLREFLARELIADDLGDRDDIAHTIVTAPSWAARAWQELPLARTRTAADGTFTLLGCEPGGNFVVARRPGALPGMKRQVVVRAGATTTIGDVKLSAGEELLGKVVDAADQPVSGAQVCAVPIPAIGHRGVAFGVAPVTSDRNGGFRIAGLPRGQLFVASRANADLPWHVHGPVAVDDEPVLRLPALSPLRAQLVRSDGQPVTAPVVELFAGPAQGELRRAGLQAQLPARSALLGDGIVDLGSWPAGCYALHVRAEGCVPCEQLLRLPHDAPFRVPLQPARAHRIRVLDSNGAPVVGARAYVVHDPAVGACVLPTDYGLGRWAALPDAVGSTDGAGEVVVAEAPMGPFELGISHPRQVPFWSLVDGARAVTTIQLPAPGALTGRALHRGQPIAPGTTRMVLQPERGWLDATTPPTGWSVPLQPDGSFDMPLLAAGRYQLQADMLQQTELSLTAMLEVLQQRTSPSVIYEVGLDRWVTIEAGKTTTVDYDTDPHRPTDGSAPGQLRGKVLVDGAPLPAALLTAATDVINYAPLAPIAADGTFYVEAVRPGAIALRLSVDDVALWEGEVDIPAGSTKELDISWLSASLRGEVEIPPGLPRDGYRVHAGSGGRAGRYHRSAHVDADGAFVLTGIPAGAWQLYATGPDGKSEVATVDTSAAAPVRLVIREAPALTGHVRLPESAKDARLLLITDTGFGVSEAHYSLAADGSFAATGLSPITVRLQVLLANKRYGVAPGEFDLRLGGHRGLVLQLGAVIERR